ncbi:helix-turn-helix domain-containing protein [Streptomyces sp. B1866]|uniref:TetR/AcrR family transcriptional regulator n=1 Tax=Streptomyces sp. B1866 TaxID=3075431 RepID=UPI00289204F9|nr:helix-turn-helix domain-containing protein [Streptomyces sp. B1866]MDT3399547.1 helix-turn-helix domain-containing protein [Streptomyces sp. B1866]
MDREEAETRALDAAERLFYAQGVQKVGMDAVRAASGVSLKRLYQLFPTKDRLVAAFLRRRDVRWRARLAEHVDRAAPPDRPCERILAVYDWLGLWFAEPGYRGCAWVNAFGELGAASAEVAGLARDHKRAVRRYLGELVAAAGQPPALADHLLLLAEGAMTTAAITGSPDPAAHARAAARTLLHAAASPDGRPA